MKAVILAAGRGKRLEDATLPINKCMLQLTGKPLIEYSLESACLANVSEIILVVGYRAEDNINAFGINYKNIRMKYVFQEEQNGLVHAMEQTREALDGDDFILLLADEILMDPKPMDMIQKFINDNLFVMCGVTQVKDRNEIKNTYAMIYNEDNNEIYRLIEKPRNPINDIMGTGNCIFKNEIFDYIPYTPINYFRKEKELPDLIQCAVDDGKVVKLFHIGARYLNINTPEDIRAAETLFKGE